MARYPFLPADHRPFFWGRRWRKTPARDVRPGAATFPYRLRTRDGILKPTPKFDRERVRCIVLYAFGKLCSKNTPLKKKFWTRRHGYAGRGRSCRARRRRRRHVGNQLFSMCDAVSNVMFPARPGTRSHSAQTGNSATGSHDGRDAHRSCVSLARGTSGPRTVASAMSVSNPQSRGMAALLSDDRPPLSVGTGVV